MKVNCNVKCLTLPVALPSRVCMQSLGHSCCCCVCSPPSPILPIKPSPLQASAHKRALKLLTQHKLSSHRQEVRLPHLTSAHSWRRLLKPNRTLLQIKCLLLSRTLVHKWCVCVHIWECVFLCYSFSHHKPAIAVHLKSQTGNCILHRGDHGNQSL